MKFSFNRTAGDGTSFATSSVITMLVLKAFGFLTIPWWACFMPYYVTLGLLAVCLMVLGACHAWEELTKVSTPETR